MLKVVAAVQQRQRVETADSYDHAHSVDSVKTLT